MTAWKVFYSDDTVISSEDATPSSIRRRADIQVIIQPWSDGIWRTLSGYDYYMWDDRGDGPKWFGGDREGLSSYLRRRGWKCVLIGDFIDKVLFEKIFNRAKEELGSEEHLDVGE